MNRLKYILLAKTQYNIQSPFLYELYSEVLAPRIDRVTRNRLGIGSHDLFAQLCYKLHDHYQTIPVEAGSTGTGVLSHCDTVMRMKDDSLMALFNHPHRSPVREETWQKILSHPSVTLTVDLFDIGLVFTASTLSKQNIILRLY
ncbi:MAG: hypothetical protein J5682_02335 [Prevotella sp.]|nr:hypothetical protein [Prevotella sp.]